MSIKALCVTVFVFTILIFGGNHYAARNEFPDEGCEKCGCFALVTLKNPDQKQKPSCSVVFRSGERRSSSEPNAPLVYPLTSGATYGPAVPGSMVHIDLYACDYVLFCDKDAEAELSCRTERESDLPFGEPTRGWQITKIWSQQRCSIFCQHKGEAVRIACDHWTRSAPTVPNPPVKTPPKPPVKKSRPDRLWSTFFGSSWQGDSAISSFVSAIDSLGPAEEKRPYEVISDSARWRLIDGEAGIDRGVITLAKGEAEARSFCTGDTVRLVGPNALSLPSCQIDVSGRWQGSYARRTSDGKLTSLAVSLNLRKESGTVRGELTTSEGTFNIVDGSQSGSDIRLQAERTIAGALEKIILNGRLTKGEIVFGGSEQLPGGAATSASLTGFARRLYIADSALPIAILNQPYSFALTALSSGLGDHAITFRLENPGVKQPEKITWTTAADSLRGRNGERFTYLCPANGTLNRSLYRGNAYTDDSSICTAAVNSHVITQQAGGVVTIQIQPGPSPGTGRFVFVAGEPQASESQSGVGGRLPKGLTFDGQSGTFAGTPTEIGNFEISVVADDRAGHVFEQPLTLVVKRMAVTNGLLLDGFVGQPYAATLQVAGGQPPYRFSGTPPSGLQLDPITGKLSGRPSSPGSYSSFEVTVRDSQNISESQKLGLSVRGATILNSYFLPEARVGVPYRMQFQAVGNLTPISWVFGRAEPSSIGLALNQGTGELSGTPTKAGNFFIDVRAEGGSSVPARRFGLTIK